ncbi:MAG TPA: hypothetical protein VER12_11970 [Polyangiaceae bacterium]|nr:hypothetical protein [Polyangiaceae bacterium]
MSARVSLLPLLSLLASSLCSGACDDSLKDVSLIEETRVLGARVESSGDPSRGSPRPGEQATLRLFVAAPSGAPHFSYTLSLCAVRLTNSGFPDCISAPFASISRVDSTPEDALLDFRVPEDIDLEQTPHAFASGLLCPDSDSILAADGTASCATGSGRRVAFEFAFGGVQDSNRNPNFADDAFLLDGQPWPANAQLSCAEGSLPEVPARSVHALSISLADSEFEPLSQPTAVDPDRETLLVSPFSSAGQLEHGFLSLTAHTPAEQRRVAWVAPTLADGQPQLLRFYFVVRDARSGEDFASRALCVVP